MSNQENFNANDQVAAPSQAPVESSHALNSVRDEVYRPQPVERTGGFDSPVAGLYTTNDGSLNLHLGIPYLFHTHIKVGAVNGAEAGVGLGPAAQVGAGAFVGVDRNGLKGDVGAGGHVLGLVGTDGHVNARLGNATGAEGGAGAFVGPLGARAGAGAALGENGLDAAVSGGARVGDLAGARVGTHLGLNDDSQFAVGGGAHLGDLGGRTQIGAYSDGNSTFRPDISGGGRAGWSAGRYDANPPGNYYSRGGDTAVGQPINLLPPEYNTQGRQAAIESSPLPPAHEAATPANMARVDKEIRTQLAHDQSYTVQKGDTYEKIAERLHPNDPQAQIDSFAKKLEKMHEANGYHSLKAGMKLNTEDPYTTDRKTRAAVAEHFGLPNNAEKLVPSPKPAGAEKQAAAMSHEAAHAAPGDKPAKLAAPEAATPENIDRATTEIRTKISHDSVYTVQKGDTYEKIAERLHPNDPQAQIDAFAKKLETMHEGNGYHSLKAGMKIATDDPYSQDRKVRAAVAQHFGWPAPGQS